MWPFGKQGGSKLPWLGVIAAAALAFAIVVLFAPFLSSREALISSDDPSRQVNLDGRTNARVEALLQQEIECDLFQGKWVEARGTKPLYQNATCPLITPFQDCLGNGRPDRGYLRWKWKPSGCALPEFDSRAFLELLRGKTLAFIGDSVTRNQYEALVCTLWQEYDVRVVRIWSAWMVNVTTDAVDSAPANVRKLHLDTLDASIAKELPAFDVAVVATGHWWGGGKPAAFMVDGKVVGGQGWRPENASSASMDTVAAYGVAIRTALSGILAHPGLTILRTYSPDHYEKGAWNTGGSCTGKTRPLREAELPHNPGMDALYGQQMAAVQERSEMENSSRLVVMDIARPFRYRADGHPGPYTNPDPHKQVRRGADGKPPPQDCVHWCLPGAIDTWNQFLFAMLQRHYQQS